MKRCFFVYILFSACLHASSPETFRVAKRTAFVIFNDNPVTLYCGCVFNKKKQIELQSCNMQSASHFKRAHRLEWEHMMPAESFGKHFKCWREKICTDRKGRAFKGRKCCKKINLEFRQAEAELYNLWPSVGLINQLRSNYRFSPLEKKQKMYGCDFKIDRQLRKVEPSNRAKGIVARANLFMSAKYHIRLSKSQRRLFEVWDKRYPPDTWEQSWANQVARIVGYENPYVANENRLSRMDH